MALSGCSKSELEDGDTTVPQLYGRLRAAWGREPGFGPLDTKTSWYDGEINYCLSGRLRQTFDHIVESVYTITFQNEQSLADDDTRIILMTIL